MKYKILTQMGELEAIYLKERPSSFFKADGAYKRVLIAPSDTADFDAFMIDNESRILIAPRETAIAVSLYFEMQGVPRYALSVNINREQISVPEIEHNSSGLYVYLLKCKLSYTKTDINFGGIIHTAYTSLDKYRTRILPLKPETEMRQELVRSINVCDSLPDAVRSIAFSPHLDGYRVTSSESTVTLDGIIALLGYLAECGEFGQVRLYIGDKTCTFEVSKSSLGYISVPIRLSVI